MNGPQATATAPAPAPSAAAPLHNKPGTHGDCSRGLEFAAKSPTTEGRFGKMFPMLPAAKYCEKDTDTQAALMALGEAMLPPPPNPAPRPTDGPKPTQESGIPALYTYFGQFIDHDISFDPSSSLQKYNDPDALVDFRTPAFDLDSVYGRGPYDQPYMYDDPKNHYDGSAQLFFLGSPLNSGSDRNARDLPRNRLENLAQGRALIGDPRNDENVIVSQLHGLFLRFHNRRAQEPDKPSFEAVQQWVRFHYEYLVLHDFLPKIVHSGVLDQLKTDSYYDRQKMKFFHWKAQPFMPVEFSAAAYRFGHSMVRASYRLNDGDNTLRPIFIPDSTKNENVDLRGFAQFPENWGIDWARFINTDERPYDGSADANKKRLQFAFKIDTSLAPPLYNLPGMPPGETSSLAQRNLIRGWRLGLPSGQSVAHAMGIDELKDDQIRIGPSGKSITEVNGVFAGKCPLWTYILAEAMHNQEDENIPVTEKSKVTSIMTPKLGQVGGRIVAEVFLGLMYGDPNSMLNIYPKWKPKCWDTSAPDPYTLRDFVKYATERP